MVAWSARGIAGSFAGDNGGGWCVVEGRLPRWPASPQPYITAPATDRNTSEHLELRRVELDVGLRPASGGGSRKRSTPHVWAGSDRGRRMSTEYAIEGRGIVKERGRRMCGWSRRSRPSRTMHPGAANCMPCRPTRTHSEGPAASWTTTPAIHPGQGGGACGHTLPSTRTGSGRTAPA